MTNHALVAAMAGAGVAVGVLLVVASYTTGAGNIAKHGLRARMTRADLRRLGWAVAVALLTVAVTQWVAAAAGMGLLVFCWDRVFGGTRRSKLATARLEGLAAWTESLRDLVATGIALPEALPASVTSAAPVLQQPLQLLTERLAGREPLESALQALGDDLDDGGADLVVAALLLNARAQGRALEAVLTALATSLRGELRVRRTIEAERRSTRRAVQIVVAVTLVTALGLCLGNPTYVAPYRDPAGQLMLGVVAAVFAAGFVWLARLSALPTAPRLLSAAGDPTSTGTRRVPGIGDRP